MRSSYLAALLLCAAAACGTDPAPTEPRDLVTRRDPVEPGADCAIGGTAVHVGHDDNGNGALDDEEIEDTELLCDPEQPTSALSSEPIEPGTQCPAGGTAVHTGLDDDRDGVLDPEEIDNTTVVCDDASIFEGDFDYYDWQDPARVAALQAARIVTGSVTIAQNEPVDLHHLELIGGDLDVSGNLTALDLSALREVVGHVELDTPGIDDFTFPAIERIGGELFVTGNGVNGERIAAPALTAVGGRVVFWWGSEGEIVMPALVSVGGSLAFEGNLTALHLDALAEVHGDVIHDDLTLTTIELPALRTIDGKLSAISSDPLTGIDLPALQTLGELHLSSNDALATVDLPALQTVTGRVALHDLPALTTLDLGTVGSIGDDIVILDAPALTTLNAPALISLNADAPGTYEHRSLLISKTNLTELSLPSLRTAGGVIDVVNQPVMTTIAFDHLEKVAQLSILQSPAVTTLRAPALIETDAIDLIDAVSLTTIDFASLRRAGRFDFRDAPLADLSTFSDLTWLGALDLDNLDQLTDLEGLSRVTFVGGIFIRGCAALTSLAGLEHVERISNQIEIYSNPALTSLAGLGGISQVGAFVIIQGNPALTTLTGLDNLRAINMSLSIRYNEALTSLDGLAALTYVGDTLGIEGNTALPASEIAELQAQLD